MLAEFEGIEFQEEKEYAKIEKKKDKSGTAFLREKKTELAGTGTAFLRRIQTTYSPLYNKR